MSTHARGFLEVLRVKPPQRPAAERVHDFRETDLPFPEPDMRAQASRCMDCGVPFCHGGCPLGNLIPEWNDLVFAGRFAEAAAALHETNNFPEVTGRVCPAPCEASCVLAIDQSPVTIKAIERGIADRGASLHPTGCELAERGFRPRLAPARSGRRVVVVGSGPAGLATSQELARAGHEVTVFEKSDRIGGLLRYGIPDFKLDKALLDRRIEQLQAEGVTFRTGVCAGVDPTAAELRAGWDALVIAGGAGRPRDLEVPGRELAGVHFAMEYLTQQNRRVAGLEVPAAEAIVATGKRVVILGGGDTGSDCVGTAHRQGAAHVASLELFPAPPRERRPDNPWPAWPVVLRTSSSHEEGGERSFGVLTKLLRGEGGRITALEAVRVELAAGSLRELPGTTFEVPCDLLLLAMGFAGPVWEGLLGDLGLAQGARGNVATQAGATNIPGVFAAGDVARGQSLVVWAIAEGRGVAKSVNRFLRGLRA
jgi:glutamate synthase (NADPH/NADH) small chain